MKNGGSCEKLFSEKNFEGEKDFGAVFEVMIMVPTLLRQFPRLLQIKKIVTNALRVIVC